MKFEVINAKLVSANSLMVFDLAIGYQDGEKFAGVFEVLGCWLKQKKDGTGNFVTFPSKLRTDREGKPILGDDGRKTYDKLVDLHLADDDAGKQGPTEAAFGFRKWLIKEATRVFETLQASDGARGAARPAAARSGPQCSSAKKPSTKPAEAPTATCDDFDDGFGSSEHYEFAF